MTSDDLVAKFGREAVIFENEAHGTFVFCKPKRASWMRFQKDVSDEKKDRNNAFDQLCRDCLVYPFGASDSIPDHAKLIALMDDYPACSVDIAGELATAARGGAAVLAGKR